MLLSFRAANHRSLKEEQQLLLVPVQDEPEAPDPVEPESLRVAGVFGSNASGKSNVLNALGFMQHMVRSSMMSHEPDAGIERDPFALDSRSLVEPSSYVVDLWTNDLRYTYGFAINDVRVVEEWLYCYPLDGKQVIFERDADGYRFGPDLPESVTQVKEITDDNTLFLTVAARSKQHVVRPVYDWFAQRLRFRSTDLEPWQEAHLLLRRLRSTDERWLPQLEELLRAADTGIERLELKRHRPTESEIAEVVGAVRRRFGELAPPSNSGARPGGTALPPPLGGRHHPASRYPAAVAGHGCPVEPGIPGHLRSAYGLPHGCG